MIKKVSIKRLEQVLKEMPRIIITHKDGSKTKAILEHTLELVINVLKMETK